MLAAGVALALWFDAQAARERAILHCRRLCDETGLQLLDHTVSLRRISLQRWQGRVGLLRRYGFEVSLDGTDRHPGTISFVGRWRVGYTVPERPAPPASQAFPPT
ncbi:DUF3301 domain-containing protein [Dokdonella sp.]|nr:DUF3301 domain-containing protein [Dokdonella sp.]MBX3692031.1 DUF3301 domain-containing protein [Dokdonella sp.]